ncbi:MAG: phage tail protein [Sandaracinaceae bacterium]|nr:phage tail protein [Sandaracinaceae bacterium]
MSEPFVGEIRMFAGNFAPRGWAFCDGQLLAISQNDALFSLLGTIYGGDGRTTFGLPDMRGRLPMHAGTGPGLTPMRLGERGGVERVTLTELQIPSHRHAPVGSSDLAVEANPGGAVLAATSSVDLYSSAAPDTTLSPLASAQVGGSQNHTNEMPFTCVNFIIALFGIYPSRS